MREQDLNWIAWDALFAEWRNATERHLEAIRKVREVLSGSVEEIAQARAAAQQAADDVQRAHQRMRDCVNAVPLRPKGEAG